MFLFFFCTIFCRAQENLCPGVETISCTFNDVDGGTLTISGSGTLPEINAIEYQSLSIKGEGDGIIVPSGRLSTNDFSYLCFEGKITFPPHSHFTAGQFDLRLTESSITQTLDYHVDAIEIGISVLVDHDNFKLPENAFANFKSRYALTLGTSPEEKRVIVPQVFGDQPSVQVLSYGESSNMTFLEMPFSFAPNFYIFGGPDTLGKEFIFGDNVKEFITNSYYYDVTIIDSSTEKSFPNLEFFQMNVQSTTTTTFKSNSLSDNKKLKEIALKFKSVPEEDITFEENAIPSSVKKLTLTGVSSSLIKDASASSLEELIFSLTSKDQKITNELDGYTSLKSLSVSNCVLTSTSFKALQNLESLTLDLNSVTFDESVKENIYQDTHINNITFISSINIDLATYIKYFKAENIQVLRINSDFTINQSPIKLPNLKSIGICKGTQLKSASTSKRSIKSSIANIEFDYSKITSITYFQGTTENDYVTTEAFPNIENITLDEIQNVPENIIQGFKGTLTIPSDFNVNQEFIDNVNKHGITIMANENSNSYKFVDGVFYDIGYSTITGIVEQCETIVIREGVTNIKKEYFSGNKKLKSITLPSTVETIDEGAFVGCGSLSYVRCNSDSVETTGSIFDENSDIKVSVPPTYKGESLGGADVVKEDDPNVPDQPENPESPKGDDPTNVGLIVGVVIAVVVVVAAIIVGVIFFIRKRKNSQTSTDESGNDSPDA